MGNQRTPGLTKRGGTWHIDKQFRGKRICESTGTSDLKQAQEILSKRLVERREARLYGLREKHTFRAAATKYLQENGHKKRIKDDASLLKQLDSFIGGIELKQVHVGSLQPFIAQRRSDGVKTKTLNAALAVVRRILNLASSEWIDEQGMTWLETAPKITLFPIHDARAPYPLSQEEQGLLFQELPDHLAVMALFKVNTGCREQEVCGLRWDFEVKVPELNTSVFIIPGERVKNGQERLVVLNRVAKSVVESLRGRHRTHVFVRTNPRTNESRPGSPYLFVTERGGPMTASNVRKLIGRTGVLAKLPYPVHPHMLRHACGFKLANEGHDTRSLQHYLGHRNIAHTVRYTDMAPDRFKGFWRD